MSKPVDAAFHRWLKRWIQKNPTSYLRPVYIWRAAVTYERRRMPPIRRNRL